jgi:hypothetical protein
MKVSLEHNPLNRSMTFVFQVDELEFTDWKMRRYRNRELRLSGIDPVGETLHLLREFRLYKKGKPVMEFYNARHVRHDSIEVVPVDVTVIDDSPRSLPPST